MTQRHQKVSITHASEKKVVPLRVIRDYPFAKRLITASDHHPDVPPLHSGRLTWFQQQFKTRHGIEMSLETVRKWFHGEAKPRPEKLKLLAQMLNLDEAWLSLGHEPELQPKEQKARNAVADGAVNLLAGVIQMNGGNPAFPDEGDKRAVNSHVDLYAIIKGAQYAFHVSLAQKLNGGYRFTVPLEWEDAFQMGVVQLDATTFKFVEIKDQMISKGDNRGAAIDVHLTNAELDKNLIKSFAQRI
jgi:Helix-turn-helix